MKAIETKYKGITFRSRLEARWAVFMDALEVKWDYEPEGYDLDGFLYLPDFWLPAQNCFYEVKPEYPTHEESLKAMRLAKFTDKRVYIAHGSIEQPDYGKDCESPLCYFGIEEMDFPYWWCECPHCGKIGLEYCGWGGRICKKGHCEEKFPGFETPRLIRAYELARCHRFWTPRDAL